MKSFVQVRMQNAIEKTNKQTGDNISWNPPRIPRKQDIKHPVKNITLDFGDIDIYDDNKIVLESDEISGLVDKQLICVRLDDNTLLRGRVHIGNRWPYLSLEFRSASDAHICNQCNKPIQA